VVQLVEALHYKLEAHGFQFSMEFFIDIGLTEPLTEISIRNISWGVKMAGV
jgi:hypothetical protein